MQIFGKLNINHKVLCIIALTLVLSLPLVYLLWVFFHWFGILIVAITPFAVLIYIANFDNKSIPFLNPFLTRHYFKTKFKVTELQNKIGKTGVLRVLKLISNLIYLEFLHFLILLFKNHEESFHETREEFQKRNRDIVVVDIRYDTIFDIEYIEKKIERGEQVDHDILTEFYQKLFDLHKRHKGRTAKLSLSGLMLLVISTVVAGTVTSLIFNKTPNVFAAIYNFTQSSWTGGYDSGLIATHAADQTGWTKYSSSTGGFVLGNNIKLATSSYWFIDDGATSTNSGYALGGGFGNGVIASTTIVGSGSSASIKLAQLTSQSASASSIYAGYSLTAPLDNLTAQTADNTKMWAAATTNPDEWYQIDLGSIMQVSQVIAYMGKNSDPNTATQGFNIDTSVDNVNWTTQAAITGNTLLTRTVNFSAANARYVRFYITQGSALNGYSWLVEFDVLESSSSGAFTSAVIDMGGVSDFTTLAYNATTSTSTSVQVDIRAGNTATPDGAWVSWQTNIANGGYISALNGSRYIQYRVNLSSLSTSTTPSFNSITINNSLFITAANLTSSVYDAGDATNLVIGANWIETGTSTNSVIKLQIRSASSSAGIASAPWCGYAEISTSTCSGVNYFETAHNGVNVASNHPLRNDGNDRYFQYKIFLTSTGATTPIADNVSVTYVVNAPPEVQNFTAAQGADGYVSISYEVKDVDSAAGSITPGFVTPSFEYWNGSGWSTASTFAVGDLNNKSVNTVSTTTYTAYTATWNPNADFDGQFLNGNFKMRITVNDNEPANNTATMESATSTLDTANPSLGVVPMRVVASTTPATITFSATDDSVLYVKMSLNSSLSDVGWAPYESATTTTLATDPDVIYYQFKDAYGNLSPVSIGSVTTPETPSSLIIQDTSNVGANEYSLFVAWKMVALPSPGFSKYHILRSTSTVADTFAEIASSTERAVNYHRDSTISSSTTYYYKVITEDANGNTSFLSSMISGSGDGIQGPGEGGGGTDVIAPMISNVQVIATTTQTATIVWDTNELSNSTVGYSLSQGSYGTEVGNSTMADTALGVGRHQVVLTNLSASTTYYFQVKSTDPAGNTRTNDNNSASYTFTTKSGAVISGTTQAEIQNSRATIVWNTDIPADSIVIFSPNSNMSSSQTVQGSPSLVTSHSVSLTGLTPNTRYYYYAKSTDGEGNIATDDNGGVYYTFLTTQDTAAPIITFDQNSNITGVGTSTATISWTADQPATSTLAYGTTSGGPYGSRSDINNYNYNHSVNLTGLTASTTYYFQLVATDENGNSTTTNNGGAGFSFSTAALPDSTPPVVSLVATSTTLSSATITWSTDENASSFIQYATSTGNFESEYVERGRSATTTNHSVTLTGLSEYVTYYFRIRSTDADGNTVTDNNSGNFYSFTTTRDSTAPIISSIAASPVTDSSAVITWTTSERATSQIAFGTEAGTYSSSTAINTNLNLTHSITLSGLSAGTVYYYKVISTDSSSNTATSTEQSFTTSESLLTESQVQAREAAARANSSGGGMLIIDKNDKVPPVITNIQIQDIKSDTAIITWNTDEEANSFVEYGIDSFNDTFGQYDSTRSHTVNLKYLSPEKIYKIRVLSADASGNLAKSEERTFSTISLLADIEQNGKKDDDANDESMLMAAVNRTIEIMNKIASQVSIGTMQNALLAQYNSIENLANIIPAPILSSEPRINLSPTTATVEWRTDKEANSLIAFSPEGKFDAQAEEPYIQVVGDSYENIKEHQVTLINLEPDTVYHYQLRSKSAVGPLAQSQDFIFRTPKKALEIGSYTVDNISPEKAVFKWITTAETDSQVKYIPYRNNMLSVDEARIEREKSFTTIHEVTVAEFEAGTVYQIEISGKDASGAITSKVIPTFFTSDVDLPPTISQVQTNLAISPGKDSKIQAVISWMTDEPSTSRVFYQKGFAASGTDLQEKTPVDHNFTKKHAVVITKFDPGAIYTFKVESTDSGGNTSLSKTYTILAPKQKETVFQVIMKNFESMFGWVGNMKQ